MVRRKKGRKGRNLYVVCWDIFERAELNDNLVDKETSWRGNEGRSICGRQRRPTMLNRCVPRSGTCGVCRWAQAPRPWRGRTSYVPSVWGWTSSRFYASADGFLTQVPLRGTQRLSIVGQFHCPRSLVNLFPRQLNSHLSYKLNIISYLLWIFILFFPFL